MLFEFVAIEPGIQPQLLQTKQYSSSYRDYNNPLLQIEKDKCLWPEGEKAANGLGS